MTNPSTPDREQVAREACARAYEKIGLPCHAEHFRAGRFDDHPSFGAALEVLAFADTPRPTREGVGEASRYHFTDEHPLTVTTAEGAVSLGAGWLAITEAEYALLSQREQEGK